MYIPSSFEPDKIKFDFDTGLVTKHSSVEKTKKEYENYRYLCNKFLETNVFSTTRLKVVNILEYIEGSNYIKSEIIEGINIEELLRADGNKRNDGIKILKEIYDTLINLGVIWLDFAPRNIILKDKIIYILDFERGVIDISKLNGDEIKFILGFMIAEELFAFLESHDVYKILGNIFNINLYNIDYNNVCGIFNFSSRRNNILSNITMRNENSNENSNENIVSYYYLINYFMCRLIGKKEASERMIDIISKGGPNNYEKILFDYIKKIGLLKI